MTKLFVDQVHAENVLQRMWEQSQNEELCDVVLIATDDTRISAHRAVLSASSDYFKGMFTSSLSESTSKEVKLSSGDGEILQSLIKFCYTGRIAIKEDIVENLLKIADLLSLNYVVNSCESFLVEQLDPTNCLGFSILAELYHCESLLEQSYSYSLEHFMEVSKTDEFLCLTAEELGRLLSSDNLYVSTEEEVCKSLLLWIQHDPENRERHKDELLKSVRMALVEPSFLVDHLKSVCTSFESKQFIEAMEWQFLPERRALNASISAKLRRSKSLLMALTTNKSEMYIHYYCEKRLKWMKWKQSLQHRDEFDVVVTKDNLYIIGGRGATNGALNTVCCVNFKTMTLIQVKPMNETRTRCCAAVLNGLLYAVGGYSEGPSKNSVERWDPKTNTWSQVASMLEGRHDFGIAVLNEKLYAVGGVSNGSSLCSVEFYDPHQNVWTLIGSMNQSRQQPLVAVANNLLYAIGGYHNSVEYLEPGSNKWIVTSASISLLNLRPGITFQDKIIVRRSNVEEYNFATNELKTYPIKVLFDTDCLFSYFGELQVTEFFDDSLPAGNNN